MDWNVNYLPCVKAWLDQLNTVQLKLVAKELKLLELCGNTLRLPHSKALGNELFELRERRFGLRLYYAFTDDKQVTLLFSGNKSSQKIDIKKAKKLLRQYHEEEQLQKIS